MAYKPTKMRYSLIYNEVIRDTAKLNLELLLTETIFTLTFYLQ